ncbi:variant erythrocyte surface antigen-1 family protein [Babesia divergens]|uniref:Variant erythrocyte surface antigen-1 family protein n=1 Tax=Babesia divergens TaxID=32595 RepID=A0AAD9LIU5_BABDI|nr:variant erythrocyte surface antigen-1 family protein [Babesia divergens]
MASSGTTSGLLRCPKNLRECIDWVLRATERDKTGQVNNIVNLKSALKAELKVPGLKTVDLKAQLDALASGLGSFIGYGSGGQVNGSGIGKKGSYESSYKGVSWPECKSGSPCSGCLNFSSSCHQSDPSSTSCHGSCCPNCDVKKAAKIFLGMLPCLYYALKYLFKQCEGDWKTLKISNQDSSLGRFLVGMGFELQKLDQSKKGENIFTLLSSLINDSDGPLEKLYEKSKIYFTSRFTSLVSPSDSKPETVRDILLWLSGLPFTSGFEDLLDHCKDLCSDIKDSSNPVQFNNFESSLYASCFLSPFVLAAIQWPGKSEIFYHNLSDVSKSLYPEDPFDLFNMLLENVRKVFPPLKFLEYQCGKDRDRAGWQTCYYGQKCLEKFNGNSSGSTSVCCNPSSLPRGIFCTSVPSTSDVHEHCTSSKTED